VLLKQRPAVIGRERERERKKGRKKERKKERKGGRRLGMDRMEISEEKLSKL
jgi:hypothetical protein